MVDRQKLAGCLHFIGNFKPSLIILRRYGSYGSNRPRGCMGPNCPFIRPPTPYNYGSNYMGPTPSPERYERPYEPMPYRPSMPMHFRRPRRPYDGFVPPYMGPSPGPGSSYPGPFERPNILGPPQWGYGRLNMPYGGPGKSPMDWQDGTDMSNGLTEPDSEPDSEVNGKGEGAHRRLQPEWKLKATGPSKNIRGP